MSDFDRWLGSVRASSRRTYAFAWRTLAEWLGTLPPLEDGRRDEDGAREACERAARVLLGLPRGDVGRLLRQWQESGAAEGLAPATINNRMTAIRSFLAWAHDCELLSWAPRWRTLRPLPSRRYRDTAGPGPEGLAAMLGTARGDGAIARRDRALIWLLFGAGLRVGEALGLELEHVEESRVAVLGKGRREREWVTIPQAARAALAAWLEVRGEEPGAVFLRLSGAGRGEPLRYAGALKMIRTRGERAGIGRVRPHGLRHSGITAVMDASDGQTELACAFGRFLEPGGVRIYDDRHGLRSYASEPAGACELAADQLTEALEREGR